MATKKNVWPYKGIVCDVLARFYKKGGQKVSFYLADKKFANGEIRTIVLLGFDAKDEFRELESGDVFYPQCYEVPSPAAYLPCEDGFVFFAPQIDEAVVLGERLITHYGREVVA